MDIHHSFHFQPMLLKFDFMTSICKLQFSNDWFRYSRENRSSLQCNVSSIYFERSIDYLSCTVNIFKKRYAMCIRYIENMHGITQRLNNSETAKYFSVIDVSLMIHNRNLSYCNMNGWRYQGNIACIKCNIFAAIISVIKEEW